MIQSGALSNFLYAFVVKFFVQKHQLQDPTS